MRASRFVSASSIFVELQGSGEEATFGDDDLTTLLGLAKKGLKEIFALQEAAVKSYKI